MATTSTAALAQEIKPLYAKKKRPKKKPTSSVKKRGKKK